MTAITAPVGYRFGHFEVQSGERRLLVRGEVAHLGAHAFDLLIVLLERSGHLVTKDELFQRVWGRVVVEDNTLQSHISALRRVLGAETIATVSGRGYRFAGEVARIEGLPKVATPKHNLPHSLTTFVGREKEIAQAKQLLTTTRLVTLTGAGGCGKTRLALEVATAVKDVYPDGVWLVELASVADSRLIAQTVANVFSIKEQADENLADTIVEWLSARQLLMVLDNAEHLLDHCAVLADGLLRRCARLVILVTSREHLGVAGELTYRVPSLAVPDPQQETTPEAISSVESVRLFVDRARLQQPDFEITVFNAPVVAAVCRRLDGIALAIELAAPRVRSMSIEELRARLDERFRVLTEGSRTALARHRTLRSLIDWSYDLLSHTEKLMLQRVSVFAGGWTLEAAEQVCGDSVIESKAVFDLLCSLVDKNLIVAEPKGGQTRYELLETVGHYARDRLRESQEEAQTQARHLDYFLALAEEAQPRLKGADQQVWFSRLEREHDNLRAALARSSTRGGAAAAGLRLAAALWSFWERGYLGEGCACLSGLLAIAPGDQDPVVRARALRGVGTLVYRRGDYPQARALLEEALALQRRLGNRLEISRCLTNLGNVAQSQRDASTARVLYEEALALKRELGDQQGIALVLNNLGIMARDEGDGLRARTLYEQGLAIQQSLGNHGAVALLLINLGGTACDRGDHRAARALFEESLTIYQELGDRHKIASLLEGFATVALASAAPSRAACLWGRAESLREELGAPLPPEELLRNNRQIATARAAVGNDSTFDQSWQRGRAMGLEDAVRYAMNADDAAPLE